MQFQSTRQIKKNGGRRTVGADSEATTEAKREKERERQADIAERVGRVGLPSWPSHYARSLIKLGEMSKDSATPVRRTMRTQIITSSSFCPGMSPRQPPSRSTCVLVCLRSSNFRIEIATQLPTSFAAEFQNRFKLRIYIYNLLKYHEQFFLFFLIRFNIYYTLFTTLAFIYFFCYSNF